MNEEIVNEVEATEEVEAIKTPKVIKTQKAPKTPKEPKAPKTETVEEKTKPKVTPEQLKRLLREYSYPTLKARGII